MIVTLYNITFSYEKEPIIQNLSLKIPAGFSLLMGPTGCGKSTLLKIIAGLYPKYAGKLTAEGQKQAAILEAEGLREAAFRAAEARERSAEAEANSTKMVSDAISNGNVQALNYFIAQKYVEAMAAFANSPNQKTLLLPMEAAGVIGSIAGIAEIATEAFGGSKAEALKLGGSVPPSTRS